jgi:hypothetical protein
MKATTISKPESYTAGQIKKVALSILNHEYDAEVWLQNNIAMKGRKFTGRKGVSDILGYERGTGKLVLCEAKTLSDKFSPDQIELLNQVDDAGGLALYATQEGIKIVVKRFAEYKQTKTK